MKVYKFGGASVKNAEGVRNLRKIIDDEQNLFIIVSAMGKTTNALEKVFEGVQKGIDLLGSPFKTHRVLTHLESRGGDASGVGRLARGVEQPVLLEDADCLRR